MLDAALIANCADPSLTPVLVEQFLEAAGSDDPLAITVRMDGKTILVPKPRGVAEALELAQHYAGMAIVRIGVTQIPLEAGAGNGDVVDARLTDACDNLRAGTRLFGKIARIVTRWYGNPTDREVLPQMFEDAVYAWKTGLFEGERVFFGS